MNQAIIPEIKDNSSVEGHVLVEPFIRYPHGKVDYEKGFTKPNLVTHIGRNYLKFRIADPVATELFINVIGIGDVNLPAPTLPDNDIVSPIANTENIGYFEIGDKNFPPSPNGRVIFELTVFGSFFPAGDTFIKELGLFLADPAGDITVPAEITAVKQLFSRVTFADPGVLVHPIDLGGLERGAKFSWIIQF